MNLPLFRLHPKGSLQGQASLTQRKNKEWKEVTRGGGLGILSMLLKNDFVKSDGRCVGHKARQGPDTLVKFKERNIRFFRTWYYLS